MTQTHRVAVAQAFKEPSEIARQGFEAWAAAVGDTQSMRFAVDKSARQVLDRIDPEMARRYLRSENGGQTWTTSSPLVGILAPLAARPGRFNGRTWRLRWVEPYLASLWALNSARAIPMQERECPVGSGRGAAFALWDAADSVNTFVDVAMRYGLHPVHDDVPVGMRLNCAYWSGLGLLADERFTGAECVRQAEKFWRETVRYMETDDASLGVCAAVWETQLECILTNMALRHAQPYHDPSALPLADRISMRLSDIGGLPCVYLSAHYTGRMHVPNLDEWGAATVMFHDMWQLEHDEAKPDHNLNMCSVLLESGLSVRELADYLAYLICSTDLPADLQRATTEWAVLTMSSERHSPAVPGILLSDGVGKRPAWDPAHVVKVKQALGLSAELRLADEDESLGRALVDLGKLRKVMEPANNLSYADCLRNADVGLRMFREWVNGYDVVHALLERSRYAR